MRVIAGIYRSRRLISPRDTNLRPTSDRLRETLFNVLGAAAEGARFVDLYAGTGAVGIEALSRGAAEVVFVESNVRAANLIQRNLDALGITSGAAVFRVEALRGLELLEARHRKDSSEVADIVFLDPPWSGEDEYASALTELGAAHFLAPAARVVVEHRRKAELSRAFGNLALARRLEEGDAALSFYQGAELGRRASSAR